MLKFIPLIIIAAAFITGLVVFPQMPLEMASHWGTNGEVNGYISRFWGIYFMPLLALGLYFLFLVLPNFDPYRQNFSQFKQYYYQFMVVLTLFLFYLYLLTIFWNLGYRFQMIQWLSPAFSLLFFFAGILTGHARQNWFMGIRTPWTLTNKTVWQNTHTLGSKLFKLVALITLLGVIWPSLAFYFLLIPVISVSLFLFAYSYWQYRQLA